MIAALRRHAELKRQHPDTILFFRMGDFYEVFGDDARTVARELQVTLTSRPTGDGGPDSHGRHPVSSVDNGIVRLLARGHKIAVAEQLTDPTPATPAPDVEPRLLAASILPTQLSLPLS